MTRVGFLLVLPLLLAICLSGQNHETTSALEQYVQQASEFSSRARANVYFPNVQSIFNGVQVGFVNVGAGNLTFLRRDLVVSGHIPIVIARVYDSTGAGSTEFGPGWNLSGAETISVEGGKAHLFSESGSEIVFIQQAGAIFRLEKDRPSGLLCASVDLADYFDRYIANRFHKGVQLDRQGVQTYESKGSQRK